MDGYYKIVNYTYTAENGNVINTQKVEYYDNEKNYLTQETYFGLIRPEYNQELPE